MNAFEYGFYDELEKLASDPRIVQPLLRPKARKFKQLGLPSNVQRKLHETRFRRAVKEGVELPEHAKFRPDPAHFDRKGPSYLPAGSLPVVRGERFHTRGIDDSPELKAADRKAMSRRDIGDFATLYAQQHADRERELAPQRLYDEHGIGRVMPGNYGETLARSAEVLAHLAANRRPPDPKDSPIQYTGSRPLAPKSVRTPAQEKLRETRRLRRFNSMTPAQLAAADRQRREELLESRRQTTPRLA